MQTGDRVKHKKLGLGRVKVVYPNSKGVRVVYDSGHETVNGASRIEVVRDTTDQPKREAIPTQPVKQRARAGTTQVDYARLDRARETGVELFPDADHVVPRIHGNQVYVEVWNGGHAKNYFIRD